MGLDAPTTAIAAHSNMEQHMSEITITEMSSEDRNSAAELCEAAFLETPLTKAALGGSGQKQHKSLLMGMKMMMKAPGRVFVAKDAGVVVGVMRIVEWPDCQKSSPHGIVKYLGFLFAGKGFRNMIHFRGIWKNHDPREPHWHLDPLCVHPERQGQGIGSKLLAYYVALLDDAGAMAYHETDQEQNERLYNRFDFVTKETETIFGIENRFMWRD